MKESFTILIADRNPHVREFLKREMMTEGYRVGLARNAREILKWIDHYKNFDLLIVDPDLPDAGEVDILDRLQGRIPILPVVVHTFLPDYKNHSFVLNFAAFVEKEGNNIDRLKEVVSEILKKSYPQRFETVKESHGVNSQT
ncbi:MAG: response regulator [Pseudomonadota bacterium]